jgi:predicted SnoaL-like aldol condensation-catalyzing enzyme
VFVKKLSLRPLCFGWLALALGCSSDDGDEVPVTSNADASNPTASNMGAGTETASGLQPALPVVENPNHEQLLSSATPELARNKRLVYDFWRTLIEARDTEAAEQYLAEDYIQHDPSADTGRAAVLAFFAAFGERLPVQERVQAKLVAMVAERDFVVLARVDEYTEPRPYTTTWFDLFRIENGVLAEHWDHGRLAMGETPRAYVPPTENPNQSAALASSDPQLAANKQLVHEMWRTLLDAEQGEEAPRFLAPGYIQHNPLASTGLEGFLAFARQLSQPREVQPGVANFIQIVAEGDLVSLATLVTYDGANGTPYTTTWFDLFRVDGGLLVEHWDTATID